MKRKIVYGGVLGVLCVSMLVVKGISQTPKTIPLSPTPTPSPLPASSPVPGPKTTPSGNVHGPKTTYLPPKTSTLLEGQPGQAQTLEGLADRVRLATMYQEEQSAQGQSAQEHLVQGQTIEELAETLKAVRAQQKELQAQEVELLAKMAEKIEDKRKDLQKAQETLQQLQGQPSGLNSQKISEDKSHFKR